MLKEFFASWQLQGQQITNGGLTFLKIEFQPDSRQSETIPETIILCPTNNSLWVVPTIDSMLCTWLPLSEEYWGEIHVLPTLSTIWNYNRVCSTDATSYKFFTSFRQVSCWCISFLCCKKFDQVVSVLWSPASQYCSTTSVFIRSGRIPTAQKLAKNLSWGDITWVCTTVKVTYWNQIV